MGRSLKELRFIFPTFEVLFVAGAFALVTHLNAHQILTSCDVFEDTHVKDTENWYGLYAAIITFSMLIAVISTSEPLKEWPNCFLSRQSPI